MYPRMWAAGGVPLPRAAHDADPDRDRPRYRPALIRPPGRVGTLTGHRAWPLVPSRIDRVRRQPASGGVTPRYADVAAPRGADDPRHLLPGPGTRAVGHGERDPDRPVDGEVGGRSGAVERQPGDPVDHLQRRRAGQLGGRRARRSAARSAGSPQAATPAATSGRRPATSPGAAGRPSGSGSAAIRSAHEARRRARGLAPRTRPAGPWPGRRTGRESTTCADERSPTIATTGRAMAATSRHLGRSACREPRDPPAVRNVSGRAIWASLRGARPGRSACG